MCVSPADVDEYTSLIGDVHVEVWVLSDGQSCTTATGKHNLITVATDASITAKDNSDGGVDVFDAGTNDRLGPVAFTVYNGELNP